MVGVFRNWVALAGSNSIEKPAVFSKTVVDCNLHFYFYFYFYPPQHPANPTPTETPTETYQTPTETITPLPTEIPAEAPPVPVQGAYTGGDHWVEVNLSRQTLYAYEGSQIVNSFIISSGTAMYPTVTGDFRVYAMYRYSNMEGDDYYLPNVPYAMYFYEGYAMHGTYWHNNFGTPMSHGCVNLRTEDAAWLYDWVSVGTPVNVHY